MAGIKGEEFRRTGNVFVNQFMDKQCQSKPDSFSSMKVKLNRLLHWTCRGAAARRGAGGGGEAEQCKGNGRFGFSGIFSFGCPGSWGVLAQSMPAKQVL